MSTAARKEREFQAREILILDHAQRLLLERGFQDWNMDELARKVEYSKGTLYLHFATKEDLALAVATRALKERADLFERAGAFQGGTRERARAIGFACCEFAVRYPDYFKVDMMLKSPSFWERVSEERRQSHMAQGGRCFRLLHGIVQEALRCGDLPRNPRQPTEHLAFSLIAVTVGTHIMSQEPEKRLLMGIDDPLAVVRRNQDIVCDGLGWKPLSDEHDWDATDARIAKEIFPGSSWWKPRRGRRS
jgi:AcrR family transcriptional regulator